MWLEMTALQAGKGHANRIKRGWLFGQWVPEAGSGGGGSAGYGAASAGSGYGGPVINADPSFACCTCGQVEKTLHHIFYLLNCLPNFNKVYLR